MTSKKSLPEVKVSPHLKEALAQGHPWIYRNQVSEPIHLASGSWVRVRCGGWQGFGLWDDRSPIAIRIFSRTQVPDRQWLYRQVERAWQLREGIRAQGTNAYRWLYGEGDGLPGITADIYDRFVVLQTYTEGFRALREDLVAILPQIAQLGGILWRTADPDRDSKVQLLWGELPPKNLIVREYGLLFQVDLSIGQKTGLFLDHRENRRFVEQISADRQVLNCFAYTGAFSLYALRGNAKSVISVDIGKGLAEAVAINLKLNRFPPDRHQFITEDCFTVLDRFATQQTKFDLIILDPPSFAKTKQNRFAALRAYTKLNRAAIQLLNPGGILVSASCTSQVSPEAFKQMLSQACTQADRWGQIIHEAGHPSDHPIPIGFMEGRYLKFVALKIAPYV